MSEPFLRRNAGLPWILAGCLAFAAEPSRDLEAGSRTGVRRIEIFDRTTGERMTGGTLRISRRNRGPSHVVWEGPYVAGRSGPVLPDARHEIAYYPPAEESFISPNSTDFHCLDGEYEVMLRISPHRAEQEIVIGAEFAGFELEWEVVPIPDGFPLGGFDCDPERILIGAEGHSIPVCYGAGVRMAAFGRFTRSSESGIETVFARAWWISTSDARARLEARATRAEIPLRPIAHRRILQIAYDAPRAPISLDQGPDSPLLEIDGLCTIEAPPDTDRILLRGMPAGAYWLQPFDEEARLHYETKIEVRSDDAAEFR